MQYIGAPLQEQLQEKHHAAVTLEEKIVSALLKIEW